MLIVKDIERLPEYGFRNLARLNHGQPIWDKEIRGLGYQGETVLALIVNPDGGAMNEMVALVEFSTIGHEGCRYEACFPLDEVMELMAAGVVEYVKDAKGRVA